MINSFLISCGGRWERSINVVRRRKNMFLSCGGLKGGYTHSCSDSIKFTFKFTNGIYIFLYRYMKGKKEAIET